MSVGKNIRRYRKSRGMTQAQLAEAVGLTEGAVRHYESGIRAVKPELLESISGKYRASKTSLRTRPRITTRPRASCSAFIFLITS